MAAPRKNYDKAVELYQGGMSASGVARAFGISHQAMMKILKRRNCQIRPYKRDDSVRCLVDGCEEAVKARGYCGRHLFQFYKYGKIISVEKIKDPGGNRKCKVEGCDRKHRANGYCDAHNSQLRKHGEITSDKIIDRNGMSTSGEYVLILDKDHPAANKRGYVLRSHLVWELTTGHMVLPPEVIHHRNGNKQDDRFVNLELFPTDEEHQSSRHRKGGVFGAIPGGIIQ